MSRKNGSSALKSSRSEIGVVMVNLASVRVVVQAAARSALAGDWLTLLQTQAVDFTLAWRRLADAAEGAEASLRALFAEPQALEPWLVRWRHATGEAGWRAGNAWAEFTDWLRLGR